MAEKTFNNVRFQFLYDTYDSWKTKNPTLKAGEIAIATIPNGGTPQENNTVATPQVLIKVGDESTPYNTLPFISGRAADVYSWAKLPNKPTYAATEITNLDKFIEDYLKKQSIVTDTDTQYRIVQDTTNKNKFTLQSKAKGAADSTFTKVSEITIPAYDDTEVRGLIGSVNNVVNGVSQVANNAMGEVTAIKTGTAVPKATQATNDGSGEEIVKKYATKAELKETNDNVSANADAIEVLNGNATTEGSVLKTVKDEINTWANNISDDKTINTFKELIDYAADHSAEFSELVGEVTDLDGRLDSAEGTIANLPNNYVGKLEFSLTNTKALANESNINKIIAGTKTVGQAEKDANGDTIHSTYAKQENLNTTNQTVSDINGRLGLTETAVSRLNGDSSINGSVDQKIKDANQALFESLAAIAKTGNVNDLVQTTGDVIIFKCGDAKAISNS